MKTILFTLVMLLFSANAHGAWGLSPKTETVTLNHSTGVMSPVGRIGLSKGDFLQIQVVDTIDWCYAYSFVPIKPEPPQKSSRAALTNPVSWVINHEDAPGYTVTITKRTDVDNTACSLPNREFSIAINNFDWTVAGAGAFTIDDLTSPVFYLEPTTRSINGQDVAGFTPRENKKARDDHKLDTAAVFHIYHSNPAAMKLAFFNWVPISFGFAMGDDQKIFAGTSLRIGTIFFLTVGGVWSHVNRLPNGLELDTGFTQDANALANIPSRNDRGKFVSFSFSLLDIGGVGRLNDRFQATAPSTGTTPPDTTASADPKQLTTTLTPATAKAGEVITIAGTFPDGDFTVFFDQTAGVAERGAGSEAEKLLKVTVPPGLPINRDVEVVVTVAGTQYPPATFRVMP